MADDRATLLRHQRDEGSRLLAQRIDQAPLGVGPEGGFVQLADGLTVAGGFVPNQHGAGL